MKNYTVAKPFQDITGFKQIGESIELDDARAAKLRRHGLIGLCKYETAKELKPEEIEELKAIYPESKTYDKKSKKVK